MKIGIISINMYSKGLNFACPLHTYAFQQFLLQNGIESTIIDYKPVYYGEFNLRNPYETYKRGYENMLKKREKCESEDGTESQLKEIDSEIRRLKKLKDGYEELYEQREVRYDKFQNFIDSTYIKTEETYNPYVLEYKDPGFDCYICATDVIWGVKKEFGFDTGFFLNSGTMEGKYKIAYAASRGVFNGYNQEQQTEFVNMISEIDEISVREEATRDWILENTDLNAVTVLDPVLLHGKEFWEKIAKKPQEKKYLLLYYVMEKANDTEKYAVEYAKKHNLDIVELSDMPSKKNIDGVKQIARYDIGPEEWLGYILNAEAVFTNSFHACCFSVIFEKKLYVGKRNGDKVGQLLKMCGLTDRRLNGNIEDIPDEIDYTDVRKRLEEQRNVSKNFILNAIKNAEEYTKKSQSGQSIKEKRYVKDYTIRYHSGENKGKITCGYNNENVKHFSKGTTEYTPEKKYVNDGNEHLINCEFSSEEYQFKGWMLRVRLGKMWVWYKKDGTFATKNEMGEKFESLVAVLDENDTIPVFPFKHLGVVVAVASWMREYKINYNSGVNNNLGKLTLHWDEEEGTIKEFKSGSVEYRSEKVIQDDGNAKLQSNGFSYQYGKFLGWKIRVRKGKAWYWLLNDGRLVSRRDYGEGLDEVIRILDDEDNIPEFPVKDFDSVVAEAVWQEIPSFINSVHKKIKKLKRRIRKS